MAPQRFLIISFLALLSTILLNHSGVQASPFLQELNEADKAKQLLAARGLEVSEEAFVRSAARGDLPAVELFLAANFRPDSRNQDGFTPLIWASGQGHLNIVDLLLA